MGLFTYDLDIAAANEVLERRLTAAAAARLLPQGSASGGSRHLAHGARGSKVVRGSGMARRVSAAARAELRGSGIAASSVEESWEGPMDEGEATLLREYEDDWTDNPDVLETWGLTPQWKEDFDAGFQVCVGRMMRSIDNLQQQ